MQGAERLAELTQEQRKHEELIHEVQIARLAFGRIGRIVEKIPALASMEQLSAAIGKISETIAVALHQRADTQFDIRDWRAHVNNLRGMGYLDCPASVIQETLELHEQTCNECSNGLVLRALVTGPVKRYRAFAVCIPCNKANLIHYK